ncbi:MAG: phosphate-starvation-inducible PsiE family protein [Chloroflexia bacterium]
MLFLAASFGVLGYSVYILPENVAVDGFPSAITAFVNELLLVVILVEILRTLLGVLRSEVISLEPFLIVGHFGNEAHPQRRRRDVYRGGYSRREVQPVYVRPGMNALVIFVITIALYLMADSKRRSEASPQSSSSRNDADPGRDNPGRDNRGGDDADSDDPGREDPTERAEVVESLVAPSERSGGGRTATGPQANCRAPIGLLCGARRSGSRPSISAATSAVVFPSTPMCRWAVSYCSRR